jgi:hypothetical protein
VNVNGPKVVSTSEGIKFAGIKFRGSTVVPSCEAVENGTGISVHTVGTFLLFCVLVPAHCVRAVQVGSLPFRLRANKRAL